MPALGVFDPELVRLAWFDVDEFPLGWFDADYIDGAVTLQPDTIASAETFGTPTLALGFTTSSIASLEAVGTAAIALGLSPASITSLEAFGTPTLSPVAGPVTLTPPSIATAESLGLARIAALDYLQPATIQSLEDVPPPGIALRFVQYPTRDRGAVGVPSVYARLPGFQVRTDAVFRALESWGDLWCASAPVTRTVEGAAGLGLDAQHVARILDAMLMHIRRSDRHVQTFTLTETDASGQEVPKDLTALVPTLDFQPVAGGSWATIATLTVITPLSGVCQADISAAVTASFPAGTYNARIRVDDQSWPFTDTTAQESWIELVVS
jgi:hypothetical protein